MPLCSIRVLALALLVGSSSAAQEMLRNHMQPITAPVRYGGVYHLATGTWTRANAPLSMSYSGAAILYDNTCPTGYLAPGVTGAIFVDEGRLPSPTSPVVGNVWGLGNDSEVGSQLTYTIDGFQVGYCTNSTTSPSYQLRFYEAYTPCEAPPAPTASILLTGLPAAVTAGALACWTIDIDLCGSSQSFTMKADGDQSYQGVPADHFGWSWQLLSPGALGGDGWLMAGGLQVAGSYQGCSGSDGTIFDTGSFSPVFPHNSDAIALGCGSLPAGASPEAGTGMGTLDQFRIEGYPGLPSGCYWFGGNPSGNFHLQLYTANTTLPQTRPLQPFCIPGGGSPACPCGNPPTGGSGRGCNNTAGTGGAFLTASGDADLGADTLVFTSHNQPPTGLSVLLQSSVRASSASTFGHGLSCLGGSLKSLYLKQAVAGTLVAPAGGDPSVSARSAALGDTIGAGTQRFYMVAYRDPGALGTCAASATLNSSSAGQIIWR